MHFDDNDCNEDFREHNLGIDFCLCFVCRSIKRGKNRSKGDSAFNVPDTSIAQIKDQYEKWKEKNNLPPYLSSAVSVLDKAFENDDSDNVSKKLRFTLYRGIESTMRSVLYIICLLSVRISDENHASL